MLLAPNKIRPVTRHPVSHSSHVTGRAASSCAAGGEAAAGVLEGGGGVVLEGVVRPCGARGGGAASRSRSRRDPAA